MKKLDLLAPELQTHPNAAEFATYLWDAIKGGMWTAPIPEMTDWCYEITKFVARLGGKETHVTRHHE